MSVTRRWPFVAVALLVLGLFFGAFAGLFTALYWLLELDYGVYIGWTIAVLFPLLLIARFWDELADVGRLIAWLARTLFQREAP